VKILITGGAGYIGSTVGSACIDAGIVPVILDDLSVGRREHVDGRAFYQGDIADGDLIDRIIREHPDIDAVVHCAARIVVSESVVDPLAYYDVNVLRTVGLLEHLARNGVSRVVFSSSASVYRADHGQGVDEESPLAPSSPYARTKAMVEDILRDASAIGPFRAVALRYFNPIGTDPAMRTGPTALRPTHALGLILAAWRSGGSFTITGSDWPTRDGSGLRDFVHVWDLARAHVHAVQRFDAVTAEAPFRVVNIGTGRGTTVRELVQAFETAAGERLTVRDGPRRLGDVAGAFAVIDRATGLLDWHPELTVADGVRDAIAWELMTRRSETA
jgi:UDP-glucose 4-epimerase